MADKEAMKNVIADKLEEREGSQVAGIDEEDFAEPEPSSPSVAMVHQAFGAVISEVHRLCPDCAATLETQGPCSRHWQMANEFEKAMVSSPPTAELARRIAVKCAAAVFGADKFHREHLIEDFLPLIRIELGLAASLSANPEQKENDADR